MTKIPCNECGALILPATAEITDGICTACKQGIRKSIEASRAYHESLKIYDPFSEHWKSLVDRISRDEALESFTGQERNYFSINVLKADVDNGGFDQFFWNSSGNYYHTAISGLEEIGATSSLNIAKDAANAIFGKRGPSVDRVERQRIMDGKIRRLSEFLTRHRQASRLERLDQLFYEDPDQLEDRLRAYAEQQGLIAPFLKNPEAP